MMLSQILHSAILISISTKIAFLSPSSNQLTTPTSSEYQQVKKTAQNNALKTADDYTTSAEAKEIAKGYQGALADYNQAIKLKPNYANAHYNLGLLKYERLKDVAGAISSIQRSIELYQAQGKTKDAQDAIDLLKKWR